MEPSWIQTIIALLVFVGGLLATVWRISWLVSNALSDMKREYNALLDLKEAELEAKIGRVYERFDDYKNTIDACFMRKELCVVTHNTTASAMAEVSRRLEGVEIKLDALMMRK